MTIDHKTLELAAKAAGIELEYRRGSDAYYYDDPGTGREEWLPQHKDGQALRLAVRLEIDLCFGANYVIADGVQEPTVNNANDPYAAVRYAIVRAASEIGRQL